MNSTYELKSKNLKMKSIQNLMHQYSSHVFLFLWILLLPVLVLSQSAESGWSVELNSARDVPYLNELEKQVILELNKVRSNPKQFAEEYLDELRTAYSGKIFTYPGQNPVKSKEGIGPLEECILVLAVTKPMQILNPEEGLTRASAELITDQKKNGGIGHITRNGSTPQNRMEKFGDWDICLAEDITYGSFEARQIVIALLIDDGVPDRAHRKNILNPCFRFSGVSFGQHPAYETICAIDYAGDYKTK
jgi:hypothetical protein